jgi:hypothetical protein
MVVVLSDSELRDLRVSFGSSTDSIGVAVLSCGSKLQSSMVESGLSIEKYDSCYFSMF